jgi:hypothetical protein
MHMGERGSSYEERRNFQKEFEAFHKADEAEKKERSNFIDRKLVLPVLDVISDEEEAAANKIEATSGEQEIFTLIDRMLAGPNYVSYDRRANEQSLAHILKQRFKLMPAESRITDIQINPNNKLIIMNLIDAFFKRKASSQDTIQSIKDFIELSKQ